MDFTSILNGIEVINKNELDTDKISELYHKFYRNFKYFPENIKSYCSTDFETYDKELFRILENWNIGLNYGLCFIGGTGNGKTHSLLVLLNKIVLTLCYQLKDPEQNIIWANYSDIIKDLKKDVIEGTGSYQIKVRKIPFLFIDDICSIKNTDWNTDLLYSVLEYRCNFNLPTFFSSNNSIIKLKEDIGERLFSRILGLSVIYEIKLQDRRINSHADRLNFLKSI